MAEQARKPFPPTAGGPQESVESPFAKTAAAIAPPEGSPPRGPLSRAEQTDLRAAAQRTASNP